MFLAIGCQKIAGLDLDPNESLQVKTWTLPEFRELLKKGVVRGTDNAYMALDYLGILL